MTFLIRTIAILSFLLLPAALFALHNPVIHEGDIDGAPFKIVVPQSYESGNVFIHVHGWRPADAPHEADLNLEDPFYKYLIESGWVIGRTAFQENGVDHDAHTEELSKLRNKIEELIGSVNLLIMEGESTAGTLVLRIAEQQPELADGVIAKGAFIDLNDPTQDSYLLATPKIPSVLMSNLTELDGPISFAAAANSNSAPILPSLRPLLRPGHVNVNWVERKDAVDELVSWIQDGIYHPVTDGTRTVPERNTGTETAGDFIANRVTSVDRFFGNATLGFHPDELSNAGITQGSTFILAVGGQQRNVFYGQSYGDVPHGEWIAFPRSDDQILIARNHESAIATANLSEGDRVRIKPITD